MRTIKENGYLKRIKYFFQKKNYHENKIDTKIESFIYPKTFEENKQYFMEHDFSLITLQELNIELTVRIERLKDKISDSNDEHNFAFAYFGLILAGIIGYLFSFIVNYKFSGQVLLSQTIFGLFIGIVIFFFSQPLFNSRKKTVEETKRLRNEVYELTIKQKIVEIKITNKNINKEVEK